MRKVSLVFGVLGLLLGLLGTRPAAVHADGFFVDSDDDTHDWILNDGWCSDVWGYCTLRAAIDPTFGLALGLRWHDAGAGTQRCRYRITALGASGKPLFSFESEEVDPTVVPPPPPPPPGIRARPTLQGVELFWEDPPRGTPTSFIGFTVERTTPEGRIGLRTPRPLPASVNRDATKPAFVDPLAPTEADAVYRVRSVDLFGRGGAWAETRLFVPDLKAMSPPLDLRAEGTVNGAHLTWTASTNPHTSGYTVSRAPMAEGPFTVITAKPLPAGTGAFDDDGLRGGSSYYYRVQALDPRGESGPPSDPARAVPLNAGPPPAVKGLQAEVGRTRVRLTWPAVAAPVAGYYVERIAPGDTRWSRLNQQLTAEPRYDDHLGRGDGARFRYRVAAVAFDSQVSSAGDEVEAVLPDLEPPDPPRFTSASGSNGVVSLGFEPAAPPEGTDSFVVLRSASEAEEGLVVGAPLAGGARSFTDEHVIAGETYWYRLVAVDASGNRSAASGPVTVSVLPAPVPAPPQPEAALTGSPFPHVRVHVGEVPPGLTVVLQRRREDGKTWLVVAGPTPSTDLVDMTPPEKGPLVYRVNYRSADGTAGPASPVIEVERKP